MVIVSDILEHGAKRFPSSPCVVFSPLCVQGKASQYHKNAVVLTYQGAWQACQDHYVMVQKLLKRTSLSTKHQNESSVVVAYISSNSIDMMLSLLASSSNAFHVKVEIALINIRWTPLEVADALKSSYGTTILFYSNEFKEKAEQTRSLLQHDAYIVEIPDLCHNYTLNVDIPTSDDAAGKGKNQELSNKQCGVTARRHEAFSEKSDASDDDALILFTSGTTSGSKGVRLSHRSLWCQAYAKLQPPCHYSSSTKLLVVTTPMFHIGGLSSALAVWIAGGCWIIPSTFKNTRSGFNSQIVIQSMSPSQELLKRTNTLVMVPAMLHILLQEIDKEQRKSNTEAIRFDSIQLILIGGQSASPLLLEKLRYIFPCALLVQTFACTEAASSLTFYDVTRSKNDAFGNDHYSKTQNSLIGDCIGMPPPHIELALVSNKSGHLNGPNFISKPFQVGLLATRGPHVMNGYWIRRQGLKDSPAVTWLVTTDLAFRDNKGLYYFCGRSKDVIRTGGETVLAMEVERILLKNLKISLKECAVFGLPDSKFGEVVCVALVLNSNKKKELTMKEIRLACRTLAGYKLPRKVFHIDDLPRNASGKILKYQLVKQFSSSMRSNL
mmetsp:Transcript_2521/g.3704  ORF Transcript_2521/g.3704 Transcript_2521/m.3704 type:complete len:609 (-) Transcript_2521:1321-3147(-)|eukprot:CAMPEP_0194224658 /NCGR_PEP_ID=MMETSP0156-20130528/37982_1 /TAXON_ID=33649 /ORGANISM="Thalassionema nitzschioides, Strain L26-B" /LENGTH=608 /DNA_ID=CAMNT_0038956333 /DNA_START=98 /DNA_END=1924 /DNA_ORIENTATION=-